MSQPSLFLKTALTRSSLRRGFYTALVVGTILNFINVDFDSPNIPKALLTYCVPFLVSVYAATTARLRFDPGLKAPSNAHLTCSACSDHSIDLKENDIIPECPKCKNHTLWKPSPRNT